jgi:hypothetical protein
MSNVFHLQECTESSRCQLTEIDPDAEDAVVIGMLEYNPGSMGSTTRLGKHATVFVHDNSVLSKCEIKGWCHSNNGLKWTYLKEHSLLCLI